MKKSFLIIFITIITLFFSCGPTKEEAKEYNDFIISHQDSVATAINELNISYNTYLQETIDLSFETAFSRVNKSFDVISKMEKFDKTTDYKDAALKMFNSYKSIIEVEHKEIVRLYSIPNDEFLPADFQKLEDLQKLSNSKMTKIVEEFSKEQEIFAEKYHLNLN